MPFLNAGFYSVSYWGCVLCGSCYSVHISARIRHDVKTAGTLRERHWSFCCNATLMANFLSWHPCGCSFHTYHPPKHCCRPSTPPHPPPPHPPSHGNNTSLTSPRLLEADGWPPRAWIWVKFLPIEIEFFFFQLSQEIVGFLSFNIDSSLHYSAKCLEITVAAN